MADGGARKQGAEDYRWEGKRSGSLCDFGTFSFFPSKNLGGAGDGGMIVTGSAELAEKSRLLCNHGAKPKYYIRWWANARLDALQAAILRVKLRHLDEWNKARARRAAAYAAALEGAEGVVVPREKEGARSAWHLYTIRVPERDALAEHLKARGIGTAIHYPRPIHLKPAMAAAGGRPGDLPVSERLSREVLCLPLYPELPLPTLTAIAAEVRSFCQAPVA